MNYKSPKIWGKSTWIFLYCIVNTYPEYPSKKEKKEYKIFFESLQNILPCKLCRHHYKIWLEINPIDKNLNSQKDLYKWLILLDNFIRLRLNKPLINDCNKYYFNY